MSAPTFWGKLTKESTRAFWKAALERPGGSFREALHGLFYLKWPEFYIKVGLGRSWVVCGGGKLIFLRLWASQISYTKGSITVESSV